MSELYLYKCTRYPEKQANDTGEWMGALLIWAESPNEAETLFQEYEHGRIPEQIIRLEIKKGIIYDDYMR